MLIERMMIRIMEFPSVNISQASLRKMLTDIINEFIRVEKSEKGLSYQQKSFYIRGKLFLIATLIDEKWTYNENGQSYFEFLKYLVDKYNLDGVWRINDL
ncbi:hypothetical protein P8832_09605 [Bacillus subtilis]|uniref:hypothetical protein n=1 Tax=Bacillus subtilis TaxID=1423 RepID=UPI002DB958DB|nr:hypothetical protein [Bacillus subtilis]MEC0434415.1 hypothetical protein [Bacillus subtilis]